MSGRVEEVTSQGLLLPISLCDSGFKKIDLSSQQRSFFFQKMLKLGWFQNRSQSATERFEWSLDSVNWEIAANSLCLWNRVFRVLHVFQLQFWQNWLYHLLLISMNQCFPVLVLVEGGNPPNLLHKKIIIQIVLFKFQCYIKEPNSALLSPEGY